jgi:hypothetical protein
MRNHRRRPSPSAVERLRLAIDCMPVATREAMLVGVTSGARIIVGAYVDREGGECPMLAAHRRGGRTDFLAFARSWDRFTRADKKARKSRPASERELRILVAQLQDSLSSATGLELDTAIREHREVKSRRLRERSRRLRAVDPRGEILARRLRPSRRRRRSQPGDGVHVSPEPVAAQR